MAHHRVLIVAKPGPLRHGLRALLSSMPHVEIMGVAAHGKAALRAMAQGRPAMVLMDCGLSREGFLPLLKQIKATWPKVQCLVLVDSTEQQREAQAAKADTVLLKGVPAARLSEAMEKLLTRADQLEREATAGGAATDTAANQQLHSDARKGQG